MYSPPRLFVTGTRCPSCGHDTERKITPLRFRILRWLFPSTSSFRTCTACPWRGMSFKKRRQLRRSE